MRSLEVVLATGTSIADFQQQQPFAEARYPVLAVAYEWERSVLYERINQRTRKMLKSGWIEEVEMLMKSYPAELKPLQAIGYREIVEHLQDKLKWEALVNKIQQRTRQYAKRQMTWFRREAKIAWHQPDDEAAILNKIKCFYSR
jgi:tRNA dimethylallyltransferase